MKKSWKEMEKTVDKIRFFILGVLILTLIILILRIFFDIDEIWGFIMIFTMSPITIVVFILLLIRLSREEKNLKTPKND